jgi:hypothetical protein
MREYKTAVKTLQSKNKNGKPVSKAELIHTINEANLEKLIKECWYQFIKMVYRNEVFIRLLLFINRRNATISTTLINNNEQQNNYNRHIIEMYSINYEEIRNLGGATLLQSTFYIDRFLRKRKKEGYFDECKDRIINEIRSLD